MVSVERVAFNDSATDLNKNHLDDECKDNNGKEVWVLEDTREDVEFTVLNLTGIELIEELHEHEGLEHHGVMEKLLGWCTQILFVWEHDFDVIWAFTLGFELSVLHALLPARELLERFNVVFGFVFSSLLPELKRSFGLIKFRGIECIVLKASLGSIGGVNIFVASSPVNLTNPAWESEHHDNQHDDLVNTVAEHIPPHHWSNNKVVFLVRLSLENLIGWWFSSKGQSSEGIHDQVNPQHLDGSKWRVLKDN